jgi:hypothetical protein
MTSDELQPLRVDSRNGWVVSAVVLVAIVLCASSRLVGQDIPVVGQPTEHFYQARGSAVKVTWNLDRTTVPEDEEIVAALVVRGATNPTDIVRPDLKKLEPFESRFIITDAVDPAPDARAKEVRFMYRLRPRNRSVKDVPTFQFHYYNPAAPAGKQFPLTEARGQPITVTPPKPKAAPPAIPLAEPEHLFAVVNGPRVLDRQPFSPTVWTWIAFALIGPLVAVGWFLGWRQVFPDATRLARMRRTRAAKRAIDAIHRSDAAVDPHGAIAAAVLGYLRARFPFAPSAVTPHEIGAALAELGMHATETDAVTDFFRACDAARFARPGGYEAALAADAEALVLRLEAA